MTLRKLFSLLTLLLAVGCAKEKEPTQFTFTLYPGARYLGELSEVMRQAHRTLKPNEEPPPVAMYETDASLQEVAEFYAKTYGYPGVAPDETNNLSSWSPYAYYRSGDLAADNKGAKDILAKLKLATDVSKATGPYRAAEILPKPNRPRVTVQRPYFDVLRSETVDRTLILMSR